MRPRGCSRRARGTGERASDAILRLPRRSSPQSLPPEEVDDMATPKMERTRHPGIYRRGGRYVVVWQHRGRQHKSFHRTLGEAREAKGARQAGESRPTTRATFEGYALGWLDTYQGRTSRGLS